MIGKIVGNNLQLALNSRESRKGRKEGSSQHRASCIGRKWDRRVGRREKEARNVSIVWRHQNRLWEQKRDEPVGKRMNEGSQLDRPQLTKLDSFGEAEVDVINLMTKKSFLFQRSWIVGCLHTTEVAYLLLTQQPRVWFPAYPKKFRGKIRGVAEVNQWRWLEESEQWLENVDQTHLVLTSGTSVLQKKKLNLSSRLVDES